MQKRKTSGIVIRDIPENVLVALKEKAESAGKKREEWLREQLFMLAYKPEEPQREERKQQLRETFEQVLSAF